MHKKGVTKLLLAKAAALLSAFVLSGCATNTPRQMTPLPAASILALAGDPSFDTADRWSFTQAVFHYAIAGKDEFHRLPVGDYLLASLVSETRGKGVTDLRLAQFESASRSRYGIILKNITTLRIKIAYKQSGADHTFTHEIIDREIGPVYSGDFSVIPFTSAGQTHDVLFHRQVRPLIDEIVRAFQSQLAQTSPRP